MILYKFFADWCGPCKVMKPLIESIKLEYEGKVIVKEVDVDKDTELCIKHNVRNIPTFVLVNSEGEEIDRLSGGQTKSTINRFLNKYISSSKEEDFIGEKQ